MEQTVAKQNCVKCVKGVAVGICNGCGQSFCDRHFPEHRRELAHQFDDIRQDFGNLWKDLSTQNDSSQCRQRIDAWEKSSIVKIQRVAEEARADLEQCIQKTQSEIDKTANNTNQEIASNQESSNFTEVDLTYWTDQLKQMQKLLKKPSPINIVEDEDEFTFIRAIKVRFDRPVFSVPQKSRRLERKVILPQQTTAATDERFFKTVGRAGLSEKGLAVKCTGYASVCGTKQYSNGAHRIRFRIIGKKNDGLFFGVMSDLQEMTARTTELASVYGWRDFDRVIVNGKSHPRNEKDKIVRTGDEIILTLDCDNNQILLEHQRTRKNLLLPVDTHVCPFPWRLLVTSFGDDCIGILK